MNNWLSLSLDLYSVALQMNREANSRPPIPGGPFELSTEAGETLWTEAGEELEIEHA